MTASIQFRDSIHTKGKEITVLSNGDDNDCHCSEIRGNL